MTSLCQSVYQAERHGTVIAATLGAVRFSNFGIVPPSVTIATLCRAGLSEGASSTHSGDGAVTGAIAFLFKVAEVPAWK